MGIIAVAMHLGFLMSIVDSRARLTAVLRKAREFVTVTDACEALNLDRAAAAKLLARWHGQGWITRVRRGLYAPVPLSSLPTDQVMEDPWTIVPRLFSAAYIGGATAAHHWDLTEQLFRSVFVYTTKEVRRSHQTVNGTALIVRHISKDKLFGTRAVWRGRAKVQVSDVHRTVIDLLNSPADGGGIRQVADCLRAYFARPDCNTVTLLGYAERLGNGAVFKRLGFLAETLGASPKLVQACANHLTEGVVKLDPTAASPRMIKRWRLWLPERWKLGVAKVD
jgi:predicted transcriptional regulator of viral defense system